VGLPITLNFRDRTCHHVGTMKGVFILVVAALLLAASTASASAAATAKSYAFPASWVAKQRASLVASTGNTGIRCHGVSRVLMRAGGYGFIRIVCNGNDTSYTFRINSTGHVQVSAVVA
jgi:hypothetical protein